MKAVVMTPGAGPRYVPDFKEPTAGENEVLLTMKAVAIKHLDKAIASGRHYSSEVAGEARIVGGDGVGELPDGRRFYIIGANGTLAGKAIAAKERMIAFPEGIDNATAAALPNAIAGSVMALRFRAGMKAGETVLINGATGFTGKIAIQVAREYGAGKIIATGRNQATLETLKDLGADEIISLKQDDAAFIAQVKQIHSVTPVNVIIDYIWGHSAGLLLESFAGKGGFTAATRYVSVGALAGDKIQVSSQVLRSANLQISGSGLGSWTKEEMQLLLKEIVPEVLQWYVDGKIKVDIVTVGIEEAERIWDLETGDGKRLVVLI
ncbi:NADPH:quinone reductase [Chitinophaga terrae (ex Kim and Jung 2007)]|uniref:NADPH:quinone reductase n=1 Tax=Chitinophaga terrae (ex Kim and Jung 2007) TaxID=408074 RepID=A0A1H3WW94_9BACT|nr:zinc-binding alcohol dehydrogenase family protein [Chitinophaga terrae (ex Kim and Jung 2007)]GEP90313.1 alcohol dehydrogenase [Chitinophaga terrae (ex Kim and Jung 2007)]SDZ90602.1 NADPH:quinone reductase [Chitinophaga terrae (ex Kim and Jung 2007)]